MRTAADAHPLVLLLLAVLGPGVAVRLTDPASVGRGSFDVLLGAGIAAFLLVVHVERRRRLDDA